MGQGSLRHDRVRNAFANVEGDVVGGDKYVLLLGGAQRRLRIISPLMDERVRFAYQEPPGLSGAREALAGRHLLILRGAPGYGKTAMAVRLLQGMGATTKYHLDSDVDFASLADLLERDGDSVERGAAFLLDQPSSIAGLRGEVYEKVQGALALAGAWLVITASSTEVADSELLTAVVDVTEAPDQRGIVSSHLRWRHGDAVRDRLLGHEDIDKLLDELLDGDPACKQAADLAEAISEEWESGRLDPERIKERRARRADEDFDIWVESLQEPAVRSLAIALAVLNGLPQEYTATCARALRERLEDDRPHVLMAGPDGRLPRIRDPFAAPRRTQLTRLRARDTDKEDGEPGRALEYKDPSYPRRVIRHAWTQYEIQSELLDWLSALVVHPAEEVRVYAAAALGVIAAESFTYLCDRIFHPWAQSEDPRRRDAVAYALHVASRDPWIRERADALVEGWFADRSRPFAQATAARMHGMGEDPERAVAALARLAVVDRATVAVAVGRSLADLLAQNADSAGLVLCTLHERSADHRMRPTALLSFLIVAAQVVVGQDEHGVGGEEEQWPALLHHAHHREELRAPFIALWRESLNQAHFGDEAQQVLRNWAALAERDPALREMFRLMVGAVAYGDPRTGRILRRCAADWVDPEELAPIPLTAAVVHAQLDLEGV
ncbi:ATP-binding protein [Streptomyces sp. ISL-10]|uniref:ATP-binding protein n=1 Tax=Streptomyces sp. ISL-10 TaxID=2819172 RepID=UPI001BEBEC99|nr:ATP-binding protein [Streptomyces sp. ISL-10]MBT2366850.1 ATP-binding protein [Streptomyces sp. ISL-10]